MEKISRYQLGVYISALKKCSREHENDATPTFNIVVSALCRDLADYLTELKDHEKDTISLGE